MRERRWLELIKGYDCTISYHPRKANVLADALNRKSSEVVEVLAAVLNPPHKILMDLGKGKDCIARRRSTSFDGYSGDSI